MPEPIKTGDQPDLPSGELTPATHSEVSGAFDQFFGAKPAETPAPAADLKPIVEGKPAADPLDALATEEKPAEPKPDDDPAPKHLNKEQAANWKTLRAEAKTALEAKTQAEARVAELEAQLAQKADPEEVKTLRKTVEDLEDRLAFFAVEQSPVFRAEFDAKIETENETVYGALEAAGVKPEVVAKYREADAVRSQTLGFWDNVTKQLKASPKLEGQALKIEAAVRNARRLATEREEALKDPAKLKSFGSKAVAAMEAKQKADEEFLATFVANAQKDHPWAKAVEVKADASPADKAAAEEHNQKHATYKSIFVKAIESDDVQVRAKIGMAAIQALELQSENTRLAAVVKQREEELARLKGASPRNVPDALAPGTKPAGVKGDALPPIDLSDSSTEATERRFEAFKKRSS